MEYREGTFLSKDRLKLFYRSWRPEAGLRAILVRLQGIGGHSGMFQTFVDYVSQYGFAVYGLDPRGHGRSEGRRGYINRWSEYQADLGCFLDLVKAAEPECPLFLV
jgi:alpha-beta hydrolase superfamily lysophospholipase